MSGMSDISLYFMSSMFDINCLAKKDLYLNMQFNETHLFRNSDSVYITAFRLTNESLKELN